MVSSFDESSTTLQLNQFTAAVRLSEIYAQEERWPEVLNVCELLYRAFDGGSMQDMMTSQTFRALQERYTHALSQGSDVSFEALQHAANHYFELCTNLFPLESGYVIPAPYLCSGFCVANYVLKVTRSINMSSYSVVSREW